MALIKCSECQGDVSDKAYLCPHCGNPLKSVFWSPVSKKMLLLFMIIGGAMAFVLFRFVKHKLGE